MTVNPYFKNFSSGGEQGLLRSLTVESIKQKGIDVKYVPREIVNYDKLFGTDDSSRYDDTHTIEMYVVNSEGYGGDRDFWSQFGNQVQEEMSFSVSIDRFSEVVTGQPRPFEGDLIFFPLPKKCFKITFVESKESFYQLGQLYTYLIKAELFEYSGEEINTGDADIDRIIPKSTNLIDWSVMDGDSSVVIDDDGNIVVSDSFDVEDVVSGSENEFSKEQTSEFVQPDYNPYREQD